MSLNEHILLTWFTVVGDYHIGVTTVTCTVVCDRLNGNIGAHWFPIAGCINICGDSGYQASVTGWEGASRVLCPADCCCFYLDHVF